MMSHHSDADLLTSFVDTGDEEAFAEILRRYGPLVHGVCRRLLSNSADRDDAWQATFFLLARKSAAIRCRTALPSWLHGTARRVCMLARRHAARRPQPLIQPVVIDSASPPVLAEVRETAAIIEEELTRLPPRYRAPLILACLHGLPKPEIITRLGLPPITVTGRLARGKALLRDRLTKRGLTPAVIAGAFSGAASVHAWPAALVPLTLAAATSLRCGQTASIAPQPLALMKGVVTMTTLHRTVWTTLVLLATLTVGLGVLRLQPAATAQQQPAQPDYTDPDLARDFAAFQGRWFERASFYPRYTWAHNTAMPGWTVFKGDTQFSQSPYFDGNLESTFKLGKTPAGKVMTMKYSHRTKDNRVSESTQSVLYFLEGDLLIESFAPTEQFPKKLGEAGNDKIQTRIYQRLTDADIQSMIQRAGGPTRMQAVRQVREIAFAMHNYHSDHIQLPQAAIFNPEGKPLLSWRVALLPYLGQKQLYEQFKLNEPWDSAHNKPLLTKMPSVFAHPDVDKDPTAGLTHYQVFTYPARHELGRQYNFAPAFSLDPKFRLSLQQLTVADGTSNTVLFAEARQSVPWTKPEDLLIADDNDPLPPLGAIPTGDDFLAAFGDGSVRLIYRTRPDAQWATKLLRQIIGYNDGMNFDTTPISK